MPRYEWFPVVAWPCVCFTATSRNVRYSFVILPFPEEHLMKSALTTLAALAVLVAAGCESQQDRTAYNSDTSNQQRMNDQSARYGEGQTAAQTERADRNATTDRSTDSRRVDVSARTRGEGERQGDRTRFTMAYPTGDRRTSQLLVEKTVPNQVRLNQPFQYEIRVTNVSDATLDDVRIREETPEGLNVTASQPERQGQGEQAGWTIGALKPKESRAIQVSAVAQKQGQLGTCVLASYQPSLCAAINVVNPQLQVTKRAPERADICEDIVWEYSVTNSGSGTSEPVTVRDQLPEGLTAADGGNVITLDAGPLREGQSKTARVRLKATRPGQLTSRAIASSAGGLQAESADSTTTVTQPKLGIKIQGPESEYVDRPIAYRVTVTNEGDSTARDAVAMVAVPGATKLVNVGTEGRTDRNTMQWNL